MAENVNNNEAVKELDAKVKANLDKMNWDALKKATGITREQIEKQPDLAAELAYGQMTSGMVFGSTEDISGMYALRAVPAKEGELWRIKAYTKENEKIFNEQDPAKTGLFLYGNQIYSKEGIKDLFEKTAWKNSEDKRVYGNANLNAGREIAIKRTVDGKETKENYLIGIHKATQRVVGVPCKAVFNMLAGLDKDGNPRLTNDGKPFVTTVYGVELSKEQCQALSEGKHVLLQGCKSREGNTFNCFVQFDPVRRQVSISHPTAAKEMERMGINVLGVGLPAEAAAAAEEQARQTVIKPEVPAEAPANKEKKNQGHHI